MKKIVFVMPIYAGTEGRAGGVYNELLYRKSLAEELGYETELFNQWHSIKDYCPKSVIFHIFMANNAMLDFVNKIKSYGFKIIVSPIFDTRWSCKQVNLFVSSLYRLRTIHAHLKSGRFICESADRICTRSEQESEMVIQGLKIDESKIHKIRNLPKSGLTTRDGMKQESDLVFFLGNWGTERKNVKRLIQAAIDLDLNLVIAGSASNGPLKREIEIMANQSPKISIKGFLSSSEVSDLYEKAKVFAMPSLFEGTGLAALDALTFGTNVLITSCGGVHDYFCENAYFVEPRSLASIKDKLKLALASDFNELSLLYISKFDKTTILEETQAMYEIE